MAETYIVKERIGEPREWSGDRGSFLDYELAVSVNGELLSETVTLTQKPETTAPTTGDEILGELKDSKYGKKLKKEWKDGPQASSQGSSGDEPGRFDRKPEHPDNVQRMRHTSALSAAPAYIDQMLVCGVVEKPTTKDQYIELAMGVVKWLESTYPVAANDVPW